MEVPGAGTSSSVSAAQAGPLVQLIGFWIITRIHVSNRSYPVGDDRFARSVKQLVLALEEFRLLEIDFVSRQEPLDTSTPIGKAMFTIIGATAELERNVIRGQVAAGLEHARAHGTKSGKPVGRPRRVFDHKLVSDLHGEGKSPRQIAAQLGLGEGTVRRVLRTGSASAQPRQNPSAAVV